MEDSTASSGASVGALMGGTYKLGRVLGHGSSGVVHQAWQRTTGAFVAVKKVPKLGHSESVAIEIELLSKLEHTNIVKYFDVVDDSDGFLYIVLEYMENGSLASVRENFGNFSEPVCAMYMRQVVTGLEYLHAQGVLHRDIKGANILTTKEGVAKLADFGVAKFSEFGVSDSQLDENVVGSPYWMAPEIIEMSAPASAACDIWSLGCTIIELTAGKPPYFDLSPMQALFRIVSDDVPPLPAGASEALRDFLLRCFHREALLRSSASALLVHPFLAHNALGGGGGAPPPDSAVAPPPKVIVGSSGDTHPPMLEDQSSPEQMMNYAPLMYSYYRPEGGPPPEEHASLTNHSQYKSRDALGLLPVSPLSSAQQPTPQQPQKRTSRKVAVDLEAPGALTCYADDEEEDFACFDDGAESDILLTADLLLSGGGGGGGLRKRPTLTELTAASKWLTPSHQAPSETTTLRLSTLSISTMNDDEEAAFGLLGGGHNHHNHHHPPNPKGPFDRSISDSSLAQLDPTREDAFASFFDERDFSHDDEREWRTLRTHELEAHFERFAPRSGTHLAAGERRNNNNNNNKNKDKDDDDDPRAELRALVAASEALIDLIHAHDTTTDGSASVASLGATSASTLEALAERVALWLFEALERVVAPRTLYSDRDAAAVAVLRVARCVVERCDDAAMRLAGLSVASTLARLLEITDALRVHAEIGGFLTDLLKQTSAARIVVCGGGLRLAVLLLPDEDDAATWIRCRADRRPTLLRRSFSDDPFAEEDADFDEEEEEEEDNFFDDVDLDGRASFSSSSSSAPSSPASSAAANASKTTSEGLAPPSRSSTSDDDDDLACATYGAGVDAVLKFLEHSMAASKHLLRSASQNRPDVELALSRNSLCRVLAQHDAAPRLATAIAKLLRAADRLDGDGANQHHHPGQRRGRTNSSPRKTTTTSRRRRRSSGGGALVDADRAAAARGVALRASMALCRMSEGDATTKEALARPRTMRQVLEVLRKAPQRVARATDRQKKSPTTKTPTIPGLLSMGSRRRTPSSDEAPKKKNPAGGGAVHSTTTSADDSAAQTHAALALALLKALKALCMASATAVSSVVSAGAIEVVFGVLGCAQQQANRFPRSEEIEDQLVPCVYYLCRIDRTRLVRAAKCGGATKLASCVARRRHLKQFALAVLCEFCHAASSEEYNNNNLSAPEPTGTTRRRLLRTTRRREDSDSSLPPGWLSLLAEQEESSLLSSKEDKSPISSELWRAGGVRLFTAVLLNEAYWGVRALAALAAWVAHDVSGRVEAELCEGADRIVALLLRVAQQPEFEHALPPLRDALQASPRLAAALLRVDDDVFAKELAIRLETHKSAIVRKSLLEILRAVLKAAPNPRLLLDKTPRLLATLSAISRQDTRHVLVNDLACSLLHSYAPHDDHGHLDHAAPDAFADTTGLDNATTVNNNNSNNNNDNGNDNDDDGGETPARL